LPIEHKSLPASSSHSGSRRLRSSRSNSRASASDSRSRCRSPLAAPDRQRDAPLVWVVRAPAQLGFKLLPHRLYAHGDQQVMTRTR
jgi:hypothetical protein